MMRWIGGFGPGVQKEKMVGGVRRDVFEPRREAEEVAQLRQGAERDVEMTPELAGSPLGDA
jgi:hypothetical protein